MNNLVHVKTPIHDFFLQSTGRAWIYHKKYKRFVEIHWHKDNAGYFVATINNKPVRQHCILAQIFIPNPNSLPQVDHIDRNRLNNSLDNLRWVDLKVQANNKQIVIDAHKRYNCTTETYHKAYYENEDNFQRRRLKNTEYRNKQREKGLVYLKRNGKMCWCDPSERKFVKKDHTGMFRTVRRINGVRKNVWLPRKQEGSSI